jgi:hypothetical protein
MNMVIDETATHIADDGAREHLFNTWRGFRNKVISLLRSQTS